MSVNPVFIETIFTPISKNPHDLATQDIVVSTGTLNKREHTQSTLFSHYMVWITTR
jgi:hypothetical protein